MRQNIAFLLIAVVVLAGVAGVLAMTNFGKNSTLNLTSTNNKTGINSTNNDDTQSGSSSSSSSSSSDSGSSSSDSGSSSSDSGSSSSDSGSSSSDSGSSSSDSDVTVIEYTPSDPTDSHTTWEP